MTNDPTNPLDLDALEAHVAEFNDQLFTSFWHFQSKALIQMIEELRRLRTTLDEWSPIVAEYLADRLTEPETRA